jgi:hypothetical protein
MRGNPRRERRRSGGGAALLLAATAACYAYSPATIAPRPTATSGRGPIVRVTFSPPRALDADRGSVVAEKIEGRVVGRGPGDTLTLALISVARPGEMLRSVEVPSAPAFAPLRVAPGPGVAIEDYRFSGINTAALVATAGLVFAYIAYTLSKAFGDD